MNLQIFILTYNRSKFLKRTLESIENTVLSNYPITVLDNCSTDDTALVVEGFRNKFRALNIITRNHNIGVCANIASAIESSKGKYTWILCDDDTIDISEFDDVIAEIEKGVIELIHVGAHKYDNWSKFAGKKHVISELFQNDYPYFKFSSFVPCNIFKTSSFQENYLIDAFANIANGFPHLTFPIALYGNNNSIYISKNQLVTATESGQSYNYEQFCIWWIRTCSLLSNKQIIKEAFIDQWNGTLDANFHALNFMANVFNKTSSCENKKTINDFISLYFDFKNKALFRKMTNQSFFKTLKLKLRYKYKASKSISL